MSQLEPTDRGLDKEKKNRRQVQFVRVAVSCC